jgi:WD40 repeat protein
MSVSFGEVGCGVRAAATRDWGQGLSSYRQALRLETHVLLDEPGLIFQQLHNRLQWAGRAVEQRLAVDRDRRRASDFGPWLRTLTQFRESEGLIRTLIGHTDAVLACAVSPEGDRVASGSKDGRVRVWDARSGALLQQFFGHSAAVTDCAFSPDGTIALSAAKDGSLLLWEPSSGTTIWSLAGHGGGVRCCAFTPDGRGVVSGGTDGSLRQWDVGSGRMVWEERVEAAASTSSLTELARVVSGQMLGAEAGGIVGLAISPDGGRVATVSFDGTLSVWRLGDVLLASQSFSERESALESIWLGSDHLGCAFRPDGDTILVAHRDTVIECDGRSGSVLRAIGGSVGSVSTCAYSPDGRTVLVVAEDHHVHLYDASTLAEVGLLRGHTGAIADCVVSSDGLLVVSAGWDSTMRVWDLRTAVGSAGAATGHSGEVHSCAFSPDGTQLVTASHDHSVRVWDSSTGAELLLMHPHRAWPAAAAFSPDGTRIVTSCGVPAIRICDARNGTELLMAEVGHEFGVEDCSFSPDGRHVLSAGSEGDLYIWDAQRGRVVRSPRGHKLNLRGEGPPVHACAWSPDGSHVVSGDDDGNLIVWDAVTGSRRAGVVAHAGAVRNCEWSPDRATLLTCGDDGSVCTWDAVTLDRRTVMLGHEGAVLDCCHSPDGRYAVSGGSDRTLRLWYLADSMPITMAILSGPITCVAHHPTQGMVACGEPDGSVHRLQAVGLDLRPVVLTAWETDSRLLVRCPACRLEHALERGQLGATVPCPTEGCGLLWAVNGFAVPPMRHRLSGRR